MTVNTVIDCHSKLMESDCVTVYRLLNIFLFLFLFSFFPYFFDTQFNDRLSFRTIMDNRNKDKHRFRSHKGNENGTWIGLRISKSGSFNAAFLLCSLSQDTGDSPIQNSPKITAQIVILRCGSMLEGFDLGRGPPMGIKNDVGQSKSLGTCC